MLPVCISSINNLVHIHSSIEAMKMENPVQAKGNGTVKAVNFAEGDQVDTEQAIIELELTD